jgi:hypothetical protein
LMLRLVPRAHTVKPQTMVYELRDEAGELVAAIYATDRGLKIVSNYIEDRPGLVTVDPDYPPALLIRLR